MTEPASLLRVAALPFATVIAAVGPIGTKRRTFAALRAYGRGLPVLGQAVVDEFQTLSAPICLVPRALAGKVYDRGLSLSYARDPEMGIDSGWPPLVVGLDVPAPAALPADWADQLASAFAGPRADPPAARLGLEQRSVASGGHTITLVRLAGCVVVATDTPLLPRQLRRLAEALAATWSTPASSGLVVALGTGSSLETVEDGVVQAVAFLGEAALTRLITDTLAAATPGVWS